jgi:DNA-binding SARP family transcriptional activator/TolB-like protein
MFPGDQPSKEMVGETASRPVKLSIINFVDLTIGNKSVLSSKKKALALFCYIVLNESDWTSRSHLAGLFWAEASEELARASLRQILFEIKRNFSELGKNILIIERDRVGVDRNHISIDIDIMMQMFSSGQIPKFYSNYENFQNDIMNGFEDVSPSFDEWLRTYRLDLFGRVIDLLQQRSNSDELPIQSRRRLAEVAIRMDPLAEGAYRSAMQLAAEDGDIGSALKSYGKLYQTLDDELGMEPSAATQDLAVRIKSGDFDKVPGVAPVTVPRPASAAGMDPTGVPSLAVLPFRPLGPDNIPDYLLRGIVDDIVCMLATFKEPRIISSNTTREIDVTVKKHSELIDRIGANYLVSGNIRRTGNKFHLSVQMYEASSGLVEWARVFEAAERELFHVQSEITSAIACRLIPSLQIAELRKTQRCAPDDLAAYHLALRGRDLALRLERKSFEEGGELLRAATEKDPYFASTFAFLADWYSIRMAQGWSPDPAYDQGQLERTVRTAIELGEENGRPLAMFGHNCTIFHRNYEEAIRLIDRGVEISPNDAETIMWSGPTLAFVGRADEAIDRAERALALSPGDPYLFRYEHFLGIAHYAAGHFEDAAKWGERSYGRNTSYTSNLRMTSAALAASGNADRAHYFADKVLESEPNFKISDFLPRQPFRDDAVRKDYAKHLKAAGLPA